MTILAAIVTLLFLLIVFLFEIPEEPVGPVRAGQQLGAILPTYPGRYDLTGDVETERYNRL